MKGHHSILLLLFVCAVQNNHSGPLKDVLGRVLCRSREELQGGPQVAVPVTLLWNDHVYLLTPNVTIFVKLYCACFNNNLFPGIVVFALRYYVSVCMNAR